MTTLLKRVQWDHQTMKRFLDGPRADVRARVRGWLEDPVFTRRPDLSLDERREQTLRWCQELVQRGATEMALPRELGGQGDPASMLAAFQELSSFDYSLVIKLGVQIGLFGGSLYNLGSQRHHDRVKRAFRLEEPGCFAMTERDHGSNVRDLATTAVFDPLSDEFVIHTPHEGARKDYIGNAARHGRTATVFAQLEVAGRRHGVHAFIVPLRDESGQLLPGIRIEDCGPKLGLNGVDNGRIWFDQVRVPRENLLDRFAQVSRTGVYKSSIQSASKRFFTMLGTLVMGRVSLTASAVSGARTAVAIAVEYGDRRRQFGPARGEPETTILDYQAHQRRLMPALATCFALDFASRHLIERHLAEDPEVEIMAAGLKSMVSWDTMQILQTCRECCGGQGYLWENRFADLKADLDVFTTFEGDNTVLMQLVAKGLLTAYRKQFRLSRVVRTLVKRAGQMLSELNPLVPRTTSEEHLRDAAFLRSIFRARESLLLVSAARRMKKRLDQGQLPTVAFNECQDHMLTLARAYTERIAVEQFLAAVERAPEELRGVLKSLCDLYALNRLYEDRAWFLEHGYFEPAKSKAVRDLVIKLCAEVRPDAVELVRSFGIPSRVLGAPIAQAEE